MEQKIFENEIKEDKDKKKCPRCGHFEKLTKHSLAGNHLPPYEKICRDCHDRKHNYGIRKRKK